MNNIMHIGITGSSGVIGQLLAKELSALDISYSCFGLENGDIRSSSDIHRWIDSNQHFDAIFHLAAIVPTSLVKEDPLKAFDVNVNGTIRLLTALLEANSRPWFFYASTSHVYKSSDVPLVETDTIAPISLYGETKYMAEQICSEVSCIDTYDIDICIGRIFSFFHLSQKKPFLYPTLLERLQGEDLSKPFFLYGADSMRDFLNAEEVVSRLLALMKQKATGIYNIASGRGTRIRDFAQGITDDKLQIETNQDQDYLVANIEKLKQTLSLE